MSNIDSIEELSNPNYIRPIKINYTQNEKKKVWEAVISHDSVAILLYHTQKKAFVIVKQLRVPVLNANKTDGMTHELCAGIVDKDTSNIQIAKEEILEECGYDVALENIQRVSSYYTSVGISGAKQTFYFASIDDTMKISEGGGLEEENIEVLYIPLSKAKEFMFDESYQKTPGLMMGFYWFFENKSEK
ncbi:NUDIX hydrolase [Sulfurimonas sp.]|uniref:NUDIX domain-containing protein n=1 Tax=Sulfurimonas sp. TaxID=2022749 RepID=UPI0025E7E6D3|nr:NUDIX hydrolase [Sulfurimonas sp.]